MTPEMACTAIVVLLLGLMRLERSFWFYPWLFYKGRSHARAITRRGTSPLAYAAAWVVRIPGRVANWLLCRWGE